ncbi:uncharacterized protein LOC105208408 [Zeugodacus cucurbitae]|uniref:uncharacterized protein LOC105208408 n=1 Tax=Zeugodacus cucurbitae TaxID=28588 RepID=UPI0023D9010F|nr:uncharacterized protein LOC105208408 [Zeugodacus cucurbitae]
MNQNTALVTCEQFKSFLRENFSNFDDLLNFSAVRLLDDGENYITTIIRISAGIRLKDKSIQRVQLILKIPNKINENDENESNEASSSTDDFHELFVTEVDMYNNIVPELEQIYANCDNKLHFKPKQYHFTHELTCDYILLEDLQARGFEIARRREGLNVEHTNAVLAKLAQWHAASAKRVETRGDYPEEYVNSYFSQQNLTLIANINAAFNEPFADCLESYDLLTQEKEIILSYMKNMNELYTKFGSIDRQAFNVLNHGDFWINNIMFRHSEDDGVTVQEVLFIDFQLPKYGCFAMDVFCFLLTSPQWNIKLRNFDKFISFYHTELIRNLTILNYTKPMPTIEQINSQLEKYGLWAFVCAQRVLAVALLDSHENSNIETFMNNNKEGKSFKKRMFFNPKYVQQVKEILPWLIEKNYMHYMTQISQ